MYEKLEQLSKLNEKMNGIIDEVQKCNKELAVEYQEREKVVLESFLSEMKVLAGYGKQIKEPYNRECGMFASTGINLDWYHGSYGKGAELSFEVDKNGDFKFTTYPSGYSSRQTIYSSKDNEWGWYAKECKKFMATNSNQILSGVQKCIEERFEKSMVGKMENVQAQQRKLLTDIGKVTIENDKDLDAKLMDAIQRAGVKSVTDRKVKDGPGLG